jgi:threonine-phosphate decarboxylase
MGTVKRIHGGNIREAAENYGLNEKDILDFSANINPLGPSPRVIKTLIENMDAVVNYPDPDAKLLRATVSDRLGIPEEMIVAGNGAVEIIYLLMKTMQPRKALIPAPTFNEYEIAVRINRGRTKDLLLDEGKGFVLDKEEIFICNPNNPTGNLTGRAEMEEIIQRAARLGKCVVIDEAFMDFVADRVNYSAVELVSKYDNFFVLYSLTKFFAIPGLRLGIGLGNPGIIKRINEIRDPWNVNSFAQLAGIESLRDEEFIRSSVEYISGEKEYLYHRIMSVKGLRPFHPSVNYIFINVEASGYSSAKISRVLGEQGILVRDCGTYKNLRPVYIRVAVKKREENDRLVAALNELGRNLNGTGDQALFG